MNQDPTPPHAETREGKPNAWRSFAEIDRAIAENRLTEYRWKKTWADPWNRRIAIVAVVIILTGWAYLAGTGFGWW